MNNLQIFNYKNRDVRTVSKNGEPWWVLKDVCDVLELSTPARVAERLDLDEVSQTHITDSLGRKQKTTIINESGLYTVILRSDKPEAIPFRKWITSEVLPSIRKTGSYSFEDKEAEFRKKAETEAKLNNSRARVSSMWLKIAQMVPVPEYQGICASYASTALAGKEIIPLPAVAEHTYTAQEIGDMFGVSRQRIGKIANANSMKNEEYGLEVWDKSPYSSKQVSTFRYNDRAVQRFRELLGEKSA